MNVPRFSVLLTVRDEFLVVLWVGVVTLCLLPLRNHLLVANILMIYLFLVFLIALKRGRKLSVLATIFSLLAFFYFFLPPHSSFEIIDLQYLLTLSFMLLIALITSHLTSGLRTQVYLAENRERHIRSLYDLASELTGIVDSGQIVPPCRRFIRDNFDEEAMMLVPNETGSLQPLPSPVSTPILLSRAQELFEHEPITWQELISGRRDGCLYLPLRGNDRNQGILVLISNHDANPLSPEQESLLKTCITFVGLVLERLGYAARAQQASVQIESERLRNALLSSLSHDIRTPVAAMAGMADAMQLSPPPLPAHHQTMLEGMRHQIDLMLSDVDKLLDMARLHRDIVTLNKEWQVLEEVVGAALKTSMDVLTGYEVRITMGNDIPLLEMDAMMMERVFCNLLENATRHTPIGSCIEIDAKIVDRHVVIQVADNGPGFPPGQEEAIFAKFVHGNTAGTSGVGLGLSIVRAVILAHGGTILAENRNAGGARFEIKLPMGDPPSVTLDTEELS
ncbi:MAG: DUF4118 domain-containing protein [Magnetococcales bacterium]|nr:DUF4118 domain-containing protein [Magnetococcales bacterium]MBF0148724.1 DUF4118 domain-containing protein [Magnetococcales bacterium]MBF0173254.1 DUF4118 domain-containing protein [Magnetococcales bacterium]MBF0630273.1 DUF4118 domain-containing protein [Magnetococcales bacterium]